MEIAQRARSFPIIVSTLLIGLSPLIPVPVVDDLITAALCRWRVKYFAERYGLVLKKEEIKTLATEQQIGCLAGVANQTFGYVLKRIWATMLPWLEAGRAADLLARNYYYGVLLDYAFAEGLYKAGDPAEAKRLNNNIYEVRKGANLRQLQSLFKASSKSTRELSLYFIRDVGERYFKNILAAFKKHWRKLSRQKEKFSEEADQATEALNESIPTLFEKYKLVYEEFYLTVAKVPDKELEDLCLALRDKLKQTAHPQTSMEKQFPVNEIVSPANRNDEIVSAGPDIPDRSSTGK